MRNIGIDILPIALLITFVWGLHPIKPLPCMNTNYLSIDTGNYFRGLFALTVIFHHLAQRTETGLLFRGFSYIGYLSVAYFFFLSGYGLQKSYIIKQEKYRKNYLIWRLPTILIPYIIVTALYWLMNFIGGTVYSAKDIIIAIVKGNPIVVFSWYIINIVVFYVVFWILMTICKKRYIIMICGGCLWYILHVIYCLKAGYSDYWYNTSQLLVIGMFWATYEETIVNFLKKYFFICTPIIWLSFFVIFLCKKKIAFLLPIKGISLLLSLLSAILFVISVILFSMKVQIGNKTLKFLGGISLEIYLTQGLFISGFRNKIIYIQNELLWCILVLVGTIVFSFILHIFFSSVLRKYTLLINRYCRRK